MTELKVYASPLMIELMVQNEEIRAEFARRLNEAADQHGLPSHGRGIILAQAIGVTPRAVSKYLNGEAVPRQDKMAKLASFLNVPHSWLQLGSGEHGELKDRLWKRRRELNLTQAALAKRVGVTPQDVQNWESGIVKIHDHEQIEKIAEALDCDLNWLIRGRDLGAAGKPLDGAALCRVPLISSVQAGVWQGNTEDHHDSYCYTTNQLPEGSFAITAIGDSMIDHDGPISIPPGSTIIAVPNPNPENGSIVVAALDGSDEVTVKRLVIDGPMKYLVPLNKRYPPMQINGNCRIVGRVKQVINIQDL